MSAGGSKLKWCELQFYHSFLHSYFIPHFTVLDPMGGMIVREAPYSFFRHMTSHLHVPLAQIALGVIVAWSRTMYFQFELLAGKSAPHEFLQLIIYKAMTFSDEIEKVDTVRAYHVRLPFCISCESLFSHPTGPAFPERTGT
jgi:hypothetical protein